MKYSPDVLILREIIGESLFFHILQRLGGRSLYIPSTSKRKRKKATLERNKQVVEEINKMKKEYPNITITEIYIRVAEIFDISYSYVHMIYNHGSK